MIDAVDNCKIDNAMCSKIVGVLHALATHAKNLILLMLLDLQIYRADTWMLRDVKLKNNKIEKFKVRKI